MWQTDSPLFDRIGRFIHFALIHETGREIPVSPIERISSHLFLRGNRAQIAFSLREFLLVDPGRGTHNVGRSHGRKLDRPIERGHGFFQSLGLI